MSNDYQEWTIQELRDELAERELPTSGRKATLVERLESDDADQEEMASEDQEDEDTEDADDEAEEEEPEDKPILTTEKPAVPLKTTVKPTKVPKYCRVPNCGRTPRPNGLCASHRLHTYLIS